jgi:hypothetical protein
MVLFNLNFNKIQSKNWWLSSTHLVRLTELNPPNEKTKSYKKGTVIINICEVREGLLSKFDISIRRRQPVREARAVRYEIRNKNESHCTSSPAIYSC